MSLLDNVLRRFQMPAPQCSRHGDTRHIYTVDIEQEVDKFLQYHNQYALEGAHPQLVEQYVGSLIENMIAHFDRQESAVQAFVLHYTQLITQNVSPNYVYHPLKFLRPMSNVGYQNYVYCLYGFAEAMFRLLQSHGMWSPRGALLGSYENYQLGLLYLIVRPEVPDASHFT